LPDSFSSPVPSGQKRRKASCDEIVPLKVEQGSPSSDAAQLVSNDSKRAQITPIPFSVETTGAQVLATKLSADLSGFPANLNEKNVSLHETLLASCPDVDDDNDVAPAHDDAPSHDNAPPCDENDDNLLGESADDNEEDDGLPVKLPSFLPDENSRSKFSSSSPRDTGLPRSRKRSRDADFLAFLSYFLSSRSTDNTRSTNNTRSTDSNSPKTLVFDEDTRDSEEPLVADVTHDPPETPVVLETPVVDDDYFHAKKKPCLDDRDENPPLDKIEKQGRGLKNNPQGPADSRRTK